MDEPLIPFDLHRMLVGDHPALFFLEIVLRTGLIYGYTLALLRWIGGRSVAQLSMIDLLLVIALGSAVGDAPFYPDVPLLAALVVITGVVLLNKGIDKLIERSRRAQRLLDGAPVAVVAQGRILKDGLSRRTIGAAEIMSMLRLQGIANLGEVEAAYLEPGGALSVFRAPEPRPGLSLVPPIGLAQDLPPPDLGGRVVEGRCCRCCGAHLRQAAPGACPACGADDWAEAVQPAGRQDGPAAA